MDLSRRAFGSALETMFGSSVFIGTCWLLLIDFQGDFFLIFPLSFGGIPLFGPVLLWDYSGVLFMISSLEFSCVAL